MRIALDPEGNVVHPQRRYDCVCPDCGAEVEAKLGDVLVHHWAHRSGGGDHAGSNSSTTTPMTPWHHDWQAHWPRNRREVPIWRNGRIARWADVCGTNNILEFQHSNLDPHDVKTRTVTLRETGKRVVWVFDARRWNVKPKQAQIWVGNNFAPIIRWLATRPGVQVLLDTGSEMLVLDRAWPKSKGTAATCRTRTYAEFLKHFAGNGREDDSPRPRVEAVDGPHCPDCYIPTHDGRLCDQCHYEANRCKTCRRLPCVCEPCLWCKQDAKLTDGLCWTCHRELCGVCMKRKGRWDYDLRTVFCDDCRADIF